MRNPPPTRRRAMAQFASWMAASPLVRAQQKLAGEPPGRIAPAGELVNTLEFEELARRTLGELSFAPLADSPREGFDRITLRPRMLVNTLELDLTTELFGEKMFAPMIVGPVAGQKRFHRGGELAMAEGAAAAGTVIVVSARSSIPFEQLAANTKTTLWYQVYPEPDPAVVSARIAKTVDLGAKAVCITVGAPTAPPIDWKTLGRLRRDIRVPALLKGIMTPEEAREAGQNGFSGIIVSNHGGTLVNGLASPIEILPSITDAVGAKIPVLVDGGFRRGTDVLMGLALGARAVLLARPPVWGLAAYGSDGVRVLLKMMQAELARDMAMCGKLTIADIDRTMVRIHTR
jgi:4-hydroxymandelate oxidase